MVIFDIPKALHTHRGVGTIFWKYKIKNLSVFHVVGLSQDPKGESFTPPPSLPPHPTPPSPTPTPPPISKMSRKRVPLRGPNFDLRFWFQRLYISTFRAVHTPKSCTFKAKNNAQTTSKYLQNNFQKPQKTGFLP